VTLPLVAALERASATEESSIRAFFTLADPADDDIARVVEIVRERGGLSYAEERAAYFADLAYSALEGIPDGVAVSALGDAVAYAVDRSR
jgi:octaprenyl-diphosphate synthase